MGIGLAVLGGLDIIFRGPPIPNQQHAPFKSEQESIQFKSELKENKTRLEMLSRDLKKLKSSSVAVPDERHYFEELRHHFNIIERRVQQLEVQIKGEVLARPSQIEPPTS
jgi:uncharacterized membrane protein YgaE (UPF0421/DUF939 family)